MGQSDTKAGEHKLLLLIAAALRAADELGLQDVAIELNAAMEKLGPALRRAPMLQGCASSASSFSTEDDEKVA